MKHILLSSILLFSFTKLSSQVQINVSQGQEIASADLQIDSPNKGLGIPQLALSSETSQSPVQVTPKDGLLVYNTTNNNLIEQGYYIWQNNKWNRIGGSKKVNTITQLIDPKILNYDSSNGYANSPISISLGADVSLTRKNCAQWTNTVGGNGHYYCNYESSAANIDFATAYRAAETAKGYIVTVTSDAEWDFIKNNTLTAIPNKTWLGYTIQKQPGNNRKYVWITGETFDNKWSNKPDVQHHFDVNQPTLASTVLDNQILTKSCTVINSSALSTNRLWTSNDCGEKFTNVIIEFNK